MIWLKVATKEGMVQVVLTDKKGKNLGLMEKINAHQNPGFLHKAVSVVLYRKGKEGMELLLQKRAKTKPLWPGYWANTVCTHPLNGESNLDCAVRRLKEEVGIEMKKEDLRELYSFYYQADYNEDLAEHEYDTVVVGKYKGEIRLNPDEVEEVEWVELEKLQKDMEEKPLTYVPWLEMILKDKHLKTRLNI